MKKKMKRGAAWFLAFALTLTGITLTPDYVRAEEPAATEAMPEIETPSQVEGIVGEALHTVELPEGWEWAEPEAVIAQGDQTCAARYTVDDETWDYTEVEGYNAEGHYVERLVQVTGKEKKESNDQENGQGNSQGNDLGSTEGNGVPVALAEGDVPLDEEHFPDEQFRKIVAEQVDTNGNQILEQSEIDKETMFDITGTISTLKGIEYLTKISYIYLGSKKDEPETVIENADLSKNTNLTYLQFYDCTVGTINASGLEKLKDVSGMYDSNGIKVSIDCFNLQGCTGLSRFAISLSSWVEVDIKSIDFTGCTSLSQLEMDNKNLKEIILKDVPSLTRLDLSKSGIESLDVSGATSLQYLFLGEGFGGMLGVFGGGLSDEIYPLKELKIGKNDNLQSVACRYTEIQKLDISGCPNIEGVMVDGNEDMTALITGDHPELQLLHIGNTSINEMPAGKYPKLAQLGCSNTNIEELDVSNNPELQALSCAGTGVTTLDVSNNPELFLLDCSHTGISELDLSKQEHMTVLSIAHTGIRGIDLNLTEVSPVGSYKDTIIIWTAETALSAFNLTSDREMTVFFTDYEELSAWDFSLGGGTTEEREALQRSLTQNYSSTIDLESKNGSVDMKDYYPGFDPTHVINVKEASNEGSVFTDITPGQPVIYTYFCGNIHGLTEAEKEFLSSEEEKREEFVDFYYEVYYKEGVEQQGMSEEEFEKLWEEQVLPMINAYWTQYWSELLEQEFGEDRVNILKQTMTVTLNITPANTWETPLSVDDITYGETPEPLAVPVYGKDTVKYEYSTEQNGTYTEEVPKTVGTYWVRAVVPAGDGYGELVSEGISFEIKKATPQFTLPSDLTAKEGQTLKDVKLPAGFRWADDSQSVGKAGTHTFLAAYTPEDTANYLVVDGIALEVKVSATEEGGTTEPIDPEKPSDTPEKPGKPEDSNMSEKGETPKEEGTSDKDTEHKASEDGSPSTGVTDDLVLWLSLLGIAAALAGVTLRKRGR